MTPPAITIDKQLMMKILGWLITILLAVVTWFAKGVHDDVDSLKQDMSAVKQALGIKGKAATVAKGGE